MFEQQPVSSRKMAALLLVLFAIGCKGPDTTPPTGSVVINGGNAYANSTSVSLSLDASDNDPAGETMMIISNAGDFSGGVWEPFSAVRAWTLTPNNDTKTVFVRFKDASENESSVYSDSIVLDTTLPDAPSVPDLASSDDQGVSDTDDLTNQTTGLTLSGTGAEAGQEVRLYSIASGFLRGGQASTMGAWSIDADLPEGVHSLVARVVDGAGNESPSSAALVVTVDTTPPAGAPVIIGPKQGENTGSNLRPVFTWTAMAAASRYHLQADVDPTFANVYYDWDGIGTTSYTPASDMGIMWVTPRGARYFIRVRGVDDAGNYGPWSSAESARYVNVGRYDADCNGDGYSDAVAGAPVYDSSRGKAYVHFGGSPMNSIADVTRTGEEAADQFGASVACAGDVNSDGYSDVIVGARNYSSNAGRAYLFYGGNPMNNIPDVLFTGEAADDYFGYSVASLGDVNGDGYGDVIVGAMGYDSQRGRAYVYYGGASMDNSADVIMTGEATGNRLGCSVGGAGDVNADGYGDAVVGAEYYATNTGRAYVYLGGAAMDSGADVTMTGEGTLYYFGCSVASAGDVNADGYSDVIIGAWYYNSAQGMAYIYFGGSTMNSTADVSMTGEGTGRFGRSVASAGDVNGDGYSDVIVGAEYYNTAQGRAYLYYGGSAMDNAADVTMTGEEGFFGCSVASAGDVNGDGFSDAIVGAQNYGSNYGRAYIYYGNAAMNNVADVTMTGETATSNFGYSVASAK